MMSKSATDQFIPKFLKLTANETVNPMSSHQNFNPLVLDSGLSALATASSIVEQNSYKREQLDIKPFERDQLSNLNIETLEAIIRNSTKHCAPAKRGEGSMGSSPVDPRSHSNSPSVQNNSAISPGNQTAVISLQASHTDPGATATALLATDDLQHLLTNGAARLGASPGNRQQFYLLVPSDVPVIMPASNGVNATHEAESARCEPLKSSEELSSTATAANIIAQRRRNSHSVNCFDSIPSTHGAGKSAAACMAAYLARQEPVNRRASVIGTVHERLASMAVNGNRDQVTQDATVCEELMNESTRNFRRRVSHNEVERRRRDRINTWIGELQKLLPPDEQAKSHYQSKGLVLKRVWEYFQNVDLMLKTANQGIHELQLENGQLKSRVQQLETENQVLRNMVTSGQHPQDSHSHSPEAKRPKMASHGQQQNTSEEGSEKLA